MLFNSFLFVGGREGLEGRETEMLDYVSGGQELVRVSSIVL